MRCLLYVAFGIFGSLQSVKTSFLSLTEYSSPLDAANALLQDDPAKNASLAQISDVSPDVADYFDGKILTRCLLRSVNWWNYTDGKTNLITGIEFNSVVGASSGDFWGFYLYRPGRITSFLNPFFLLHLRYASAPSKNKQCDITRITQSQCTVVFIYATWCPFSMASAPYVNALARAFPQLQFFAIDVDEYLLYKWSLRVFYTPKLKIFISGNVYREYNGSDTNLDEMVEFLWRTIRALPLGAVDLRREDFAGPIPTQLTYRSDSRLFAAWIVSVVCGLYLICSRFSLGDILNKIYLFFKSQLPHQSHSAPHTRLQDNPGAIVPQ